MESFYTDLDQVLARTRNYEQTNLMGDRNAKVGEGKLEDIESVSPQYESDILFQK